MTVVIHVQPVADLLAIAVNGQGLALATSIERFSFEELVERSELIFQGQVSQVRQEEIDGMVYSFVRFEVVDVVKGFDPGLELELRFLGGEVPGKRVQVAEMVIPEQGERGFYFVESLDGESVNPLLGWSQGHFLVGRDEQGEDIVPGSMAAPTQALQYKQRALANKRVPQATGRSRTSSSLRQPPVPAGVSPRNFKQTIRLLLEPAAQ